MIATLLRRSFWNVYDHLGRLLLGHLLWFVLISPFLLGAVQLGAVALTQRLPWLLSLAFSGFVAALLVSPASLGYLEWFIAVTKERDEGIPQIWRGFRRYLRRGLGLVVGLMLLNGVLYANGVFYGTRPFLPPLIKILLWSLLIWADLFLWGATLYLPPLLVSRHSSLRNAIQKSVALLLDNPALSLWLLFGGCVGVMLSLLTGVGLLLFLMVLLGALMWHAFELLDEKYAVVVALVRDEGVAPRRKVTQRLKQRWREEPRRTWRELLKPWE